ncbi:MAG: hemolysin family protein [Alphaproteobacteria bacterium]|nr:hemolysin family protein [Alphaproteobacteria bacterium]
MADATPDTRKAESGPSAPKPSSWPQTFVSLINRLARGKDDSARLRESLEEVIEESDAVDRPLAREERSMMLKLLSFGELTVADVMVPRADIIGVEVSTSLDDLVRMFRDAQHSRLPVYRESLDNPIGMVHIKELIGLAVPESEGAPHPKSIQDIRRDVLFVPPSMPVVNLLVKMQATRIHMALVIDEYGGTDGLASIEDLVEQIVGDIEDEHDTDEAIEIVPRGDGEFDASARVDLEEIERLVGLKLADDEAAEEIDTLAGLVFSLVGRVPQRGEIVKHPVGIEFEVLDADPRRLRRLRIRVTKLSGPGKAQPDPGETNSGVLADVDG